MKRLLPILTLFTLFNSLSFDILCQISIKGQITHQKKEPIFRASVYFKGTFDGASTDTTGEFVLRTDLVKRVYSGLKWKLPEIVSRE